MFRTLTSRPLASGQLLLRQPQRFMSAEQQKKRIEMKIAQRQEMIRGMEKEKYEYECPIPLPLKSPGNSPKDLKTNLLGYFKHQELVKRQQEQSSKFVIPFFRTGSILKVTRADALSDTEQPQVFVGICISVCNKGIGTSFTLLNSLLTCPVEQSYMLYSPLIKDIQVLRLARRCRSKLYYLREHENNLSSYPDTMEPEPFHRDENGRVIIPVESFNRLKRGARVTMRTSALPPKRLTNRLLAKREQRLQRKARVLPSA